MSKVTYHRQLDGGPTIVVKNGFLDERGGQDPEMGPVQRSKSAPQRLPPETAEDRAEILTNEDGSVSSFRDRFLSGDVSIATSVAEPRSPFAGPVDAAEGPSGLLLSAMQHTPKQIIEEPANKDDLAADFKLDEPAVDFDLIGFEDEGDANVKKGAAFEDSDQPYSAQRRQSMEPPPHYGPQLNAQLLQQLLASQVLQQMSAQHLWQLHMHAGSRPSSVQPSMHSSPHISPHIGPQPSPQLVLLSPLTTPKPSQHASPEVSRPQSPDSRPASPPQQPMPWPSPCPVGLQAFHPQPHTIRHFLNMETGMHQVFWHLDASKLKGQERQTVSPPFELPFEGQVSFRLVLLPKPNPDGKGGASFQKSGGVGSVHLKCEAAKGMVNFFVSISSGRPDFKREPRGPVKHNFAELSTCSLPKGQEMWDFTKAIDKDTQTFAVCLEIASSGT
mmetsp:Transcript_34860/g.80291  ORF Transcript_34860/g.80291 Transcript_34860/m.80291 type:complete len:444 (+) Transcript_34860:66-1397(+)